MPKAVHEVVNQFPFVRHVAYVCKHTKKKCERLKNGGKLLRVWGVPTFPAKYLEVTMLSVGT